MKKRFLLKISGELFKNKENALSLEAVDLLAKRLTYVVNKNVELGIVVGAGNIFRGISATIKGYDRVLGDQIGMIGTIINALSLKERLLSKGVSSRLVSGIKVEGIADVFNKDYVEECFRRKEIIIFCGGTGNPYFSTDTLSAIRALQINADCLLKATKVDGIYDKDPIKYTDAKFFKQITYDEIIKNRLSVIDLTAVLILKENKMKLRVFNMYKEGILEKACLGEDVGTLVEL